MRYFTLGILIVIAAGIGVLIGVMLARPSGTTLAVTTQQREAQITLGGASGAQTQTQWWPLGVATEATAIDLDPAKYPSGATFWFELVFNVIRTHEPPTACFRLYNITLDSPVSGSEECGPEGVHRARVGPVALANGSNTYVMQGWQSLVDMGGARVVNARIIVEWEEELVMEPGVGGIVVLRTDTDAPSEAASTSPLPIGASVALGVLVLGAGGLYVVKLRRG